MKKLITLVILIVMSMGATIVAAQNFTQKEQLYRDFDSSTANSLVKLLEDGKAELQVKKAGGKYNEFRLYYTPQKKSEIIFVYSFLSQNEKERISWWYLVWCLGIIAMIIAHVSNNPRISVIAGIFTLIFAVGSLLFSIYLSSQALFIVSLAAILISILFVFNLSDSRDKNEKAIIYYICVGAMMLMA